MDYEQKDLFGYVPRERRRRGPREQVHNDYEGFTEKFKPKKTTDDCYTPPAVYDALLAYLGERGWLTGGERIVRPFWPGGDYEAYDYREGDVVVDNPPFSILSRVVDFYTRRGVRFWLFAPHLTLFGYAGRPVTLVVSHARLRYENGALVTTDFVTNLLPLDVWVEVDGQLARRLEAACKGHVKPGPPRLKWPANVVTAARLGTYIAARGGRFTLRRREGETLRRIYVRGGGAITIFGGGILLSDRAAARYAEAEAKAQAAARYAEAEAKAQAAAQAVPLELGPVGEALLRIINERDNGTKNDRQ